MDTVTAGIPQVPVSVGGTGTTAKTFGSAIYVPGTLRQAGKDFKIKGSGSVTTGTTGNAAITLFINYPAGQYPVASITAASLTSNVATYTAANNFVAGQFVIVAGCTTAALNFTTGKAIVAANTTAFTVAITNANVAAENETGATATLGSITLIAGNNVSVTAGSAPFTIEANLSGDALSGVIQGTVEDEIANTVADAKQAIANKVPGIDFTREPALMIGVAVTFGTSNANNAATLNKFVLEA